MFNKKTLSNILVYYIIFLSLFNLTVFGLDVKLFTFPVILLFLIFKSKVFFRLNSKILVYIYFLSFILIYSILLFFLLSTSNYFEILRTLRSFVTLCILLLLFSTKVINGDKIFLKFKVVIFFHSIAILIGVLFPDFENAILFISQYDKEQLLLRSTGFSSGYDDAGFLINLIIAFNLIESTYKKNNFFNFFNLIFCLSVLFTSRFNILIMILIFISSLFLQFYYFKRRSLMIYLLFPFLIVLILLTLSVTIDFPTGFRTLLISTFPFLEGPIKNFFGSYSDYGLYNYIIGQHIQPILNLSPLEFLFGKGIRVLVSDIGYIKTIYSIGFIGFIFQYFTLFLSLKLSKQQNIFFVYYKVFLLLSLIIEFKMQFLFSSGGFEAMILIYLVLNERTIFYK